MKIQQLIEREPFGEIIERTLSPFLSCHYNTAYHVKWYDRYSSSNGSHNEEQVWYCNPALNIIFSANADSRLLQSVRQQYSHTPFPWRRLVQKNYVALATTPALATYFTRSAIGIRPAIPDDRELLIVGGNNRIRLIYPKQGRVISVLKHGFDPEYIEREVSVRQRKGDWPIPELLGYDPDYTWFEERYVDGLALNRLSSEADQANVLKEAVTVLSRWLRVSQTEVRAVDYVDEVIEYIHWLIINSIHTKDDGKPHPHLNPLPEGEEISLPDNKLGRGRVGMGFSSNEILDWLKLIRECVKGLVNKAGDTLQLSTSHGDFQPGNILLDSSRRLWLIDWEHSAKRQLLYDVLVYGLSSRFPQGLAERIKSLLLSPEKFLSSPLIDTWPELIRGNESTLRLTLVVFLLEELAWYLKENHNPLFRKQSGGWLAFRQEFLPALTLLNDAHACIA